jgi:hypothetical protein
MTFTATRGAAQRTTVGFERAEAVDAVVDPIHHHDDELRDLLSMADFLAPEVRGGRAAAREAAVEIAEWAERDPELLAEAERRAHAEHHDDSAKILHFAHDLVAA